MSTTEKCLKETSDYSAEDARFMEMAIRYACAKLGTFQFYVLECSVLGRGKQNINW